MKLSRTDVYELIDEERDYQEGLLAPGEVRSTGPQDVASYLLLMNSYMHKAQSAWVDNHGDEKALEVVRKIAGIAVRCMQEHGAPRRIL